MAAVVNEHIPIFSQRGFTCGPDILFTVLFESDVLRPYFKPFLDRSPAALLASKDQLKRALGLAVKRYMKMTTAPSLRPSLLRTTSTNAGEGKEVLNILSECGPDNIGMRPGILKKLVREVFTDDALNAFDFKQPVRVGSLPDDAIKPSAIKAETIFALIFELDFFKGIPVEADNNNWYERRYGGINLTRKTSSGHIVAFLKRGGEWYFADNEVGWLHKMKDQRFVPDHVIKAIQENMGRSEPFSPLLLSALPIEVDPNVTHLRYTLNADGASYTGTEYTDAFDESQGYLAAGEVHILMTPSAGGRRKTRRRRRRSA